ncbi:hypothetical protein DRF65_16605 [Chryseobacterium pennae]|uniref:Prolyl 4-hydroxylase alpha subunit Fe(2+) 2OG dioxygenase domain-containing protein n=1 Tax=Chryseobacterium pennae TaxID=2258962 RepID=A0A3D9C648_9FLAO|nr:hypothetical protein [Chryseobacterium pennae]REC61335.1 hypothetical protein DRF65_16605 [Chryseobacterium pennae]
MIEFFQVLEDYQKFDIKNLKKVLDCKYPAYIIRNFLNDGTCLKLKEQFLDIINETNGGNRAKDFVPVLQIGATQFKKTSVEYIEECKQTKSNIDRFLSVIENEIERENFLLEKEMVSEFNKEAISFRASKYDENYVNRFTIRQWKNSNLESLSLLPHEDLSQLNLAKNDDYEIGDVKTVVACNLCVSNNDGGELLIWNFEPDTQLKKLLGVENCGYPYPMKLFHDKESISLQINEGDLYFINANLIHAVKEIIGVERITAGRFMGYISKDTVVYWT